VAADFQAVVVIPAEEAPAVAEELEEVAEVAVIRVEVAVAAAAAPAGITNNH
jgi:hypothetical protein